ncbi:hypothetical protein [Natrinema salaciae]|uniref:Uncharacterized protein n=1 Tax=Natrinema salaciae TaxID=1186196 RepID=A0A1H9PS31_9EURY|nr:hypothetical protein [Natrinema salaciae]SER50992.1 hypothetical protein SAMN04489841_3958 [Natrinema salaciae]
MIRGGSDLPDALLALVIVGVIAYRGLVALNGAAEASSFSRTFRSTAFAFLDSTATAIVIGVGAVGTTVAFLVWFAGSGRGR